MDFELVLEAFERIVILLSDENSGQSMGALGLRFTGCERHPWEEIESRRIKRAKPRVKIV